MGIYKEIILTLPSVYENKDEQNKLNHWVNTIPINALMSKSFTEKGIQHSYNCDAYLNSIGNATWTSNLVLISTNHLDAEMFITHFEKLSEIFEDYELQDMQIMIKHEDWDEFTMLRLKDLKEDHFYNPASTYTTKYLK